MMSQTASFCRALTALLTFRWAEVARKSHPGCRIGLVLDQDTQLNASVSVDVLHRLTIDKSKFGRNEYNDLYHWQVGLCCC